MVVCLLCLLMLSTSSMADEQFGTEITVCDLQIPKSIKQANATFSIRYSFELDKDGRPVKVAKIQDRYASKEALESCIGGWRFQGLSSGQSFIATFRWQHGKGWVEITVVGKNFKQVIRIPEGLGY
jgi:hypothetical protein